MSGTVGQGTMTFGALTAKFDSTTAFNIDGKSVPAVECTNDDDTNKEYLAGNLPDYGQVSGTINVLATSIAELNTLIGTSATLTWTSDLEVSTNGTNASLSGTALFLEAPMSPEDNQIVKAAAVFQWTTAPTYTNEAV